MYGLYILCRNFDKYSDAFLNAERGLEQALAKLLVHSSLEVLSDYTRTLKCVISLKGF